MSDLPNLNDWQLDIDEQGIAWLFFDKAESTVNTIGRRTLEELETLVNYFEHQVPKGIIIASKKSTGFIAGANIEEIRALDTPEKAVEFVSFGQKVINRFAKLRCPKLAMIEGFCLGGGLELSLACDYRIALDESSTRIGLPEVLLGIQPGWGGTVRLPRLIGPTKALELIVSGRALRAKPAERMGVIDYALPKREMKRAAVKIILDKPKPHKPAAFNEAFRFAAMRKPLSSMIRKQVAKRANPEHYPAPFCVIDNWNQYGVHTDKAYDAEIDAIEKIAIHDTSKNLVRIFFLQEAAKEKGKVSNFKAKHVHVIGAGTMGADIATWCAMQGLKVTLQDQTPEKIAPALKRAHDLFKKRLKTPRLVEKYMDLLIPDTQGEGIRHADVVIEAVFEDLKVKQEIFKMVERKAPDHAILATNTSSIPLDEINTVMQRPSRLVGIHFFNPVSKMQLVEIVHGNKTDDRIKDEAMAFVHQIKKLPLSVKSSPGFLVNRVLTPYLLEAVTLLTEGVPAANIDKAAKDFGMPMGPIELADVVGLDICLSVANHLIDCFPVNIPEDLQAKVKAGHLGKKTGEGFYSWRAGKPVKAKPSFGPDAMPSQTIQNRLILRLINESMSCLREGIVETGDELDTGIIFGTGFAPFRGGPIHYAETLSFTGIREQLDDYATHYGERFKPDTGWKEVVNHD